MKREEFREFRKQIDLLTERQLRDTKALVNHYSSEKRKQERFKARRKARR